MAIMRYLAVAHDASAMDTLDLAIAHSEFLVLVGPSSCGPFNTIRMLAGMKSIESS
jgi:multiple sugar transport system ATP-binding protein